MECDLDVDEETELQELEQLKALLRKEQELVGENALQCSSSPESIASIMTPEDRETYNHILNTLEINKKYDEALMNLERKLASDLHDIRLKLHEIQSQPIKPDKPPEFRYVMCTRPYFKDRNNYFPPDNEDTITMRDAGMYDFSDVSSVSGWTIKDKREFINEMFKFSKEMRKTDIKQKITYLQNQQKVYNPKEQNSEIQQLKKELETVHRMSLDQLALPLDEEYEWEAIAIKLNRRHSAQEYRALWRLFLHPSINKAKWCKQDTNSLLKLAHDHKFQDWDTIAKTLGTNRSAYQCFVYFKTNMGISPIAQKWTKPEEDYLLALIDFYKIYNHIPWGKVAAQMTNRTKIQIYNKYARLTESRKGRFLPEEDAIILACISKFGVNYREIMHYVPGRSIAQIRVRVQTLRNEAKTSTVWTIEEDKKLIQLMSNQDSSINFASLRPYFPDKDRSQLRARFVTLEKWMRKHPSKDISRAPRRGARRLAHGQQALDLDEAVESLKKRVETEVQTKKKTRLSKESPEHEIESCLEAALITEHIRSEEMKKLYEAEVTAHNVGNDPTINEKNLTRLLILLLANLSRDRFYHSEFFLKYPRLIQDDKELVVKVKSYSKKATVTAVHIEKNTVDIWGSNTLTSSEYVLPPNYATISGCKKFLAYISSKPPLDSRTVSMQMYARRNRAFKEQLALFRDRFTLLFLWPTLLSNEDPYDLTRQ